MQPKVTPCSCESKKNQMYFLEFKEVCTCMCQLATWHTGLCISVVLPSKLAQFLESHVGPTQMGQGIVNGTVAYCLH